MQRNLQRCNPLRPLGFLAPVAGVALVAQITPLFVQRARIEVLRPGEALHPDLQRPATKDTTEVHGDLQAVEARVTRALAAAMQAEADAYLTGPKS